MKKVITKAVLDMETMEWIPSLEESHSYDGPWAKADIGGIFSGLFGGASKAETQQAKDEAAFTSSLQQEQGVVFKENQDAQKLLTTAWDPVIKGGPYQYGFSTAEDQLLQDQIRTEGAQATTNTINAAELRQQQATGGASSGPTGGNAALEAMSAQIEAQSTGASLAKEKLAGYERGGELFKEATGVESGIMSGNNAAAAANAATGAAGALNEANKTVDAANANSLTAKLIGGATQGGMTALTGGLGGMMTPGSSFGAGAGSAIQASMYR